MIESAMMNLFSYNRNNETLPLTSENIDLCSERIVELLEECRTDRKTIAKIRLTAESILLKFLRASSGDQCFTFYTYREFGKTRLQLEIKGGKLDLNDDAENDLEDYFSTLVSNTEIYPECSYKNGTNYINIRVPGKKGSPIAANLAAVVLALVTFRISGLAGSENVEFISEHFIIPVFNTLMNLLKTVAILEIFFSTISSICSMKNRFVYNKFKKTVLGHLIMEDIIVCVASCIVISSAFKILDFSLDSRIFSAIGMFKVLLGIIPQNIIEPFETGNAPQIMFLGIVIGNIVLGIGKNMESLVNVTNAINKLVIALIHELCRLMPLIIYVSMIAMLLEGNMEDLHYVWPLLALLFAGWALIAFVTLVVFKMKCRVSLRTYSKRILIPALTGLSTASSVTCIPEIEKICEEYEIPEQMVSFSVPMIHLFYKLDCCLLYSIDILIAIALTGGSINISTLAVIMVFTLIFSIATSPVQGGIPAILTLLASQAGIGDELVPLMIAVLPFQEMICKGFEVAMTPCEIAIMTKKL